jgi:hypothetical protein
MSANSEVASNQTPQSRASRGRVWIVCFFGCVLGLLLLEGAARAWVARRWSPDYTYVATHQTAVRGRFTYDPEMGYVLSPDYQSRSPRRTHNALGVRGSPISARKSPGTWRIVLAGASRVYGEAVSGEETNATQLEHILRQRISEQRVEVVNAGVPS